MPPAQRIDFWTGPRRKLYDAGKRYATYFPSWASFDAEWNAADDESTWEFLAPMSSMASDSSTDSCSSASTTVAQEIATRYRAGMPLETLLSDFSPTPASSKVLDDTPLKPIFSDHPITSESEVSPPIPEKDHLVTAQSSRGFGRYETRWEKCK
ncbi:hypothetical protein C0992_011837 [Termitomyces sp. T32_za158]|nr:hypothetical protein C0992_011837 [Termitomyces sp. T32_za158]